MSAAALAPVASARATIQQLLLHPGGGGYGGKVGPYRVMQLLGSGTQATVFLAADAIRQVALKVIDADRVRASTWASLRKEARRLAGIRNEHVVLVHGFDEATLTTGGGETRTIAYISLEYMPGGSLIDLEKSEAGPDRRLPVPRAIEACLGAARGISALHEAGIVHCDIKPHNILTDGRRSFRLSDLGVAADIGLDHTRASGSLFFIPPEIIAAHHDRTGIFPISPACDLYSLGATLYRLLTGRSPVEMLLEQHGQDPAMISPEAVWEAFARGSVLPPPSAVRPGIPSLVDDAVLRATAVQPGQRFASADHPKRGDRPLGWEAASAVLAACCQSPPSRI